MPVFTCSRRMLPRTICLRFRNFYFFCSTLRRYVPFMYSRASRPFSRFPPSVPSFFLFHYTKLIYPSLDVLIVHLSVIATPPYRFIRDCSAQYTPARRIAHYSPLPRGCRYVRVLSWYSSCPLSIPTIPPYRISTWQMGGFWSTTFDDGGFWYTTFDDHRSRFIYIDVYI
jgi:hypothetical protein